MKKGWKECNLDDYINLIDYRGRTPIKTNSGVRLITAKNVKLGYLQLEPQEFINSNDYESWMTRGIPNFGDVIFTTEAPLGNVAQIDSDEKLAFAQRIIVMQPEKNEIDQTFLKYMLLSPIVRKRILSKGTGATVQGIKSSLLKKIKISYPQTLSEQQRIVTVLDETFAAIEQAKANVERNLQNAKELFQSELNSIFSQKGEGWVNCNLEDYVNFIDYRGRTPVKTSSGVRLITAKNVKLGYLQIEPQEFIHKDNYCEWMRRGIPNYGDVIFTTEAPLANVAQINMTEKLAFAQRIIVMQPDKNKLDQTFLKYMLLSIPIRNKILEKGTGATVQGIKSKLLKKIDIAFPNEILEQQQIVKRLDALSLETKKLESKYQAKLAALEALKKSVLEKAFKGEI